MSELSPVSPSIGYFPNEKGDYTLTVNHEPIAICETEELAKQFCDVESRLLKTVFNAKMEIEDLRDQKADNDLAAKLGPVNGVSLIAKERLEQIVKHGRTVERDKKENEENQLAIAAQLLLTVDMDDTRVDGEIPVPPGWDPYIWEKMCIKSYENRLIIVGALVAAAIDQRRG